MSETWHAANMGEDRQGLVICDTTGDNIAAVYDATNAPLIAAAPDLFNSLVVLLDRCMSLDMSATQDGLTNCDAIMAARMAINKAQMDP